MDTYFRNIIFSNASEILFMCIIDYFKLFPHSCAIKTLNLKFLTESKVRKSLYNSMAAKMTDELEITYVSFCSSYTIIMELDTKKTSRRKIWTREWLLKRNEEGAYNGILNDLRLNDFQMTFSYWNSINNVNNDRGRPYPMDTSSSIRHRFEVEIPRGKFIEITSILKGESTWKLWHRLDVEISTWIRLSKSTKYQWVFHVDFSTLFQHGIDITFVMAVSIVLFPNILCSGNLF